MYFGTSGLSLGKKFVYDKSTDTLTVTGNIVANSLTLGSGVTIDAEDISGLGSEVSYYVNSSGAIIKGKTYSGSEYSSEDKQTAYRSFSVSSNGLLEANNAIIYGTIYASAGSFTGSVDALSMTAKQYYKIYFNNLESTIISTDTWYSTDKILKMGLISDGVYISFKSEENTVQCYSNFSAYGYSIDARILSSSGSMSCGSSFTCSGLLTANQNISCSGTINTSGNIYCGDSYLCSGVRSIEADSATENVVFGPRAEDVVKTQITKLRGYTVRIYSHTSGAVFLGSSGSTAITSDEHLKDIYSLDSRYEQFFMNLEPVTYVYKYNGHRKHIGFGARQVEQALIDAGLTTEQFAGIVKENNVSFETEELGTDEAMHFDELYSLRYEEFISLNTKMIQKCIKKIDILEEENSKLKEQISLLTTNKRES